MSTQELKAENGKWIATYGKETKRFETINEAVKWLDDCDEKERSHAVQIQSGTQNQVSR